jgi:serine/threonine protein kinase
MHSPEHDARARRLPHEQDTALTDPIDLRATPPPNKKPAAQPNSGRPDSFSFLLPPVEEDEIGRLGNYRVLRLLGQGGMGFVFLAEDIALRRRVALKVLKPDVNADPDGWQRFLREARLMASLKHDHLVTVFQVGQDGQVIYLAMELLEGETLGERAARAGLASMADVLRIGSEIASGLAVIHRNGLVHRDIKPSNLWLEQPGGRVKILDFGLARLIDDDACYTRSGMVVGTPAYMAPEQARGERIDGRSDLFSLGAVLYYLCTGTLPFGGMNAMAVLSALAIRDPRPIHELNPQVPRRLAGLVMQLLAKEPADRPTSAEAVVEALGWIADNGAGASVTARTAPTPTRARRPKNKKSTRTRIVVQQRQRGKVILLAFVLVTLVGAVAGVALALAGQLTPASTPPPGPTHAPAGQAPNSPAPGKVYLSELQPFETSNWFKQPPGGPPPDGKKKGPPPGGPPSPDGKKKGPPPKAFAGVQVGGVLSPHGLFMHAPVPDGGTVKVSYRLDGQFGSFHANVSLNDGPAYSATPLTFVVRGDGKVLWKSRGVQSQADTQTCDVAVQGVQVLVLEVQCPGDAHGGHAVWIEPHVAR